MAWKHIWGLTYAVWLRARWSLIGVAVFIGICTFAYPLLGSMLGDWSSLRKLGFMIPIASLLLLSLALSHGEGDPKTQTTGFPHHQLRLPVSTGLLVGVPITAGMLTQILYYCAWFVLVLAPAGLEVPLFWPLVAIVAANAWLQSVSWALGKKPVWGILVLTGIITLIIALAMSGQGAQSIFARTAAGGALILIAWSAFAFSHLTVSKLRHGGELFGAGETRLPVLPPPVRKPFSSKERAQFWFEWRQFGYLVPAFCLVIGLIILLIPLLKPMDDQRFMSMVMVLTCLTLYLPGVMGSELAKPSFGAKSFELTTFLATRPLGNQALAAARLKLMAGILILCWLVYFLIVALMVLLAGYQDTVARVVSNLSEHWGTGGLLLRLACLIGLVMTASWSLAANTLTLGLTGRKKIIAGVMAVIMILGNGLFLGGLIHFSDPSELVGLLDYALPITGITAFLAVLGLALTAWFGRFVASPSILGLPGLLIVISVLLTPLAVLAFRLELEPEYQWSILLATLTIGCLAILPFIAAPVAISLNRHR